MACCHRALLHADTAVAATRFTHQQAADQTNRKEEDRQTDAAAGETVRWVTNLQCHNIFTSRY
jgi:plastocyanin